MCRGGIVQSLGPARGDPRKDNPSAARRADRGTPALSQTVKGEPKAKAGSAPSNASAVGTPTRIDTAEGARIWAEHGVLAENPVKIGALAA